MNKKELIKLKDGAVVDIRDSFYHYSGSCPTCNYGSYFESEYDFIFKNKTPMFTLTIKKEMSDMPLLSTGDMFRIICNLDNEELRDVTEKEFGEFLLKKIRQYARENIKNDLYTLNNVEEFSISDSDRKRVIPNSSYRLEDMILWAFEDNDGRIVFYQVGYNRVSKNPVIITTKEIKVSANDSLYLESVSLSDKEIIELLKNTKLYNKDMLTFVKKLEHQSRKKEVNNGNN